MGRLSTCKLCGAKLKKEEKHTFSNKTYCEKCYNIKVKEKNDYDSLISYILKCFNIEVPTGLILKQIKEYKTKFGFTYAGMMYCLWYLTGVKNMKLDLKYGIAMVQYQYENSREYFEQQQAIQKSAKETSKKTVNRKVRIRRNTNTNKFLLDLDNL